MESPGTNELAQDVAEKYNGKIGGAYGITLWNILVLILLVGSYLLQNTQTTTHLQDFEIATTKTIDDIRTEIKELRKLINPTQTSIAKLEVEVQNMKYSLVGLSNDLKEYSNKADNKLDRIIREIVPLHINKQ